MGGCSWCEDLAEGDIGGIEDVAFGVCDLVQVEEGGEDEDSAGGGEGRAEEGVGVPGELEPGLSLLEQPACAWVFGCSRGWGRLGGGLEEFMELLVEEFHGWGLRVESSFLSWFLRRLRARNARRRIARRLHPVVRWMSSVERLSKWSMEISICSRGGRAASSWSMSSRAAVWWLGSISLPGCARLASSSSWSGERSAWRSSGRLRS